jgi:uncharacterized membrane protein
MLNEPEKRKKIESTDTKARNQTLFLAQTASFSALIAVTTALSTALLGIPLPPPLSEITFAPAIYLTLSVLFPRKVSFWSTAVGSAIGEAINVLIFGSAPAAFAVIYIPGMIWARAPEALIMNRFRRKSVVWLAFAMVIATVYETLAFFFPDWFFYSFTFFYGAPSGVLSGLSLAAFDFGTLIDLVWIPVALLLIRTIRSVCSTQFFGEV